MLRNAAWRHLLRTTRRRLLLDRALVHVTQLMIAATGNVLQEPENHSKCPVSPRTRTCQRTSLGKRVSDERTYSGTISDALVTQKSKLGLSSSIDTKLFALNSTLVMKTLHRERRFEIRRNILAPTGREHPMFVSLSSHLGRCTAFGPIRHILLFVSTVF